MLNKTYPTSFLLEISSDPGQYSIFSCCMFINIFLQFFEIVSRITLVHIYIYSSLYIYRNKAKNNTQKKYSQQHNGYLWRDGVIYILRLFKYGFRYTIFNYQPVLPKNAIPRYSILYIYQHILDILMICCFCRDHFRCGRYMHAWRASQLPTKICIK